MKAEIERIIRLKSFQSVFKRFRAHDPERGKHYQDTLIAALNENHNRMQSALANPTELRCCLYREILEINKQMAPFPRIFEAHSKQEAELWAFAMDATENFFNGIEADLQKFFSIKKKAVLRELRRRHAWHSGFIDAAQLVKKITGKLWKKVSDVEPPDSLEAAKTLIEEVLGHHLAEKQIKQEMEKIFTEAKKKYDAEWKEKIKQTTPDYYSYLNVSDLSFTPGAELDIESQVLATGVAGAVVGTFGLAAGWHTISYALLNVFPPIAAFAAIAATVLAIWNKDKSREKREAKIEDVIKQMNRTLLLDIYSAPIKDLGNKSLHRAMIENAQKIVREISMRLYEPIFGSLTKEDFQELAKASESHIMLVNGCIERIEKGNELLQAVPEDHKKFLRKKYKLKCNKAIFSEDEVDYLEKYGCWLEALVTGAIKPLPDRKEQERFVMVAKGEAEPSPGKFHEMLWSKYQKRIKWEKENKDLPRYKWIDPSEQWMARSDMEKMSPYYR